MSGYTISGKIIELKYEMGRIFVHVNAAPRHAHRDRVEALSRAVFKLRNIPAEGGDVILPLDCSLDIWDPVTSSFKGCTAVAVTLKRLDSAPKLTLQGLFGNFGTPTPYDFFIEWLRYE